MITQPTLDDILQRTIVRPCEISLELIKKKKEDLCSFGEQQQKGIEDIQSSTPVISGSRAPKRRAAASRQSQNKAHQMRIDKALAKISIRPSSSSNEENRDKRVDVSSLGRRIRSKDHIQVTTSLTYHAFFFLFRIAL